MEIMILNVIKKQKRMLPQQALASENSLSSISQSVQGLWHH